MADKKAPEVLHREEYISINHEEESEVNVERHHYQAPNFLEIFGNEGKKHLNDILLQPNIPTDITQPQQIIKRVIDIVNKKKKVTMASRNSYIGGHYVSPTQIGVIQHASSGTIEVVPPGRYMCLNPYVKWRGTFDISRDLIRVDFLTIVNVKTGQFGKVTDNNYPFLLAPGRHVRLSGVFKYTEQVPINQGYIAHQVIHVVQVARGSLGKVLENFIPKLLKPGRHTYVSARFNFSGMDSASSNLINHGTITRFRVNKGQVVLAWEDQEPIFFTEPGLYTRDSPNFRFEKFVDSLSKYYKLGSRKVVTVNMGEVGISYKNGKLLILPPGRHHIDHQNHIFTNFMSIQQRTLDLTSRDKPVQERNPRLPHQYLECETKDLVKVGLKAILIYKIENPEKALLEIGDQGKIEPLLLDTAIATLNGIIRSTTLTEVARASQDPKRLKAIEDAQKAEDEESEGEGLPPAPSAPMFFQRAHDEFLFKLHDRFLADYGINIVDLRIESFKIIEEELASQISRQAVVTAKTQTELANLEGKNQIATSNFNRDAEVQMIKNRMNAQKIHIETETKNNAEIARAEAQAKQNIIISQGKADALKIEAEARAQATMVQAQADLKYVQAMGSTELGKQIALLKLKTEMVTKALQGTQKVVYIDSSNPLGFFQQFVDRIPQLGNPQPQQQQNQ